MFKRLVEMLRAEGRLAPEIRLQLVDGLFYPFASLIAGALVGIWIAATVTILAEDRLLEATADFTLIVAVIRIFIGFRYTSRKRPVDNTDVRFWELAYAIPASLFSLCLGMLCLLAITRVQDPALHPALPPLPPLRHLHRLRALLLPRFWTPNNPCTKPHRPHTQIVTFPISPASSLHPPPGG